MAAAFSHTRAKQKRLHLGAAVGAAVGAVFGSVIEAHGKLPRLLASIYHRRQDLASSLNTRNKQQSMQRTAVGDPRVKTEGGEVAASPRKVIATFYLDAVGILMIDYLEKGRTITGAYYA